MNLADLGQFVSTPYDFHEEQIESSMVRHFDHAQFEDEPDLHWSFLVKGKLFFYLKAILIWIY